MEVDNEGGEAETKEKRKEIFPSPIDGPEDDQIHITATVRAVKGVANLIGYPALVKTARDWPVNEAVAALTDEEKERTDRGHPPYHRIEYAHSEKPSSSSTALFRQDVSSRVDDMKFPERPEGIEDWQYAFTGKRGSLSRLADARENYENEFRVQVERSGFGITTKDIHPYPATVFDNDRETKDKVAESLRVLAIVNGSFLLWGNRASEDNLNQFKTAIFRRDGKVQVVHEDEMSEATFIPRNAELGYYRAFRAEIDDIISPLAREARRELGLTASEKFVKMLSNSRAVSIAGATKTELGISPRPPQGAYPEPRGFMRGLRRRWQRWFRRDTLE